MTLEQFLEDLQEIMQRDDPLTPDMDLSEIDEWDSLTIMSCMAYFDRTFGIKTTFPDYEALGTVQDVIDLAKGAVE